MMLVDAERVAREENRRIRHQDWDYFIGLGELAIRKIEFHQALSNLWELEPRMRKLTEAHFRAAALPELQKYLDRPKADELLRALEERIFYGVEPAA
jgi:hypothetical protein